MWSPSFTSNRMYNRHACRPSRRLQLEVLENRLVLSVADGTVLVINAPNKNPHSPLGVVGVNPHTGAQSLVSTGGYFSGPLDLREAPNRDLYVADQTAFGTAQYMGGAIIRIDPGTGKQQVVARGGLLNGPDAIEVLHGHIFVTDAGPFDGSVHDLVEINPANGEQRLISRGGSFSIPIGLAPAPGDNVYVADYTAFGTGALFEVNVHTGAQTLITKGGYMNFPVDMALDPHGDIVVANGGSAPTFVGSVVRVDPRTHTQQQISSGHLLLNVDGDTVDREGQIFVGSYNGTAVPIPTGSRIIGINPLSGTQKIVSQGGYLDFVAGMAVYHTPNGEADVPPGGGAVPAGSLDQARPISVDLAPGADVLSPAAASTLPEAVPTPPASQLQPLRTAAQARNLARSATGPLPFGIVPAAIDSLFAGWGGTSVDASNRWFLRA